MIHPLKVGKLYKVKEDHKVLYMAKDPKEIDDLAAGKAKSDREQTQKVVETGFNPIMHAKVGDHLLVTYSGPPTGGPLKGKEFTVLGFLTPDGKVGYDLVSNDKYEDYCKFWFEEK